jgi:hypothetical protein
MLKELNFDESFDEKKKKGISINFKHIPNFTSHLEN